MNRQQSTAKGSTKGKAGGSKRKQTEAEQPTAEAVAYARGA